MTSEIFFLFSRCDAAATVNHPPPPHSGETWGISHKAKAKPNNDNALHKGEIFLSLIPTKIRIIPHIKETKKHLVQTHSTTVLCLQLFQQEMHSHSPSRTFDPCTRKMVPVHIAMQTVTSYYVFLTIWQSTGTKNVNSWIIIWFFKIVWETKLFITMIVSFRIHFSEPGHFILRQLLANEGVTPWGLKFDCKYKLTITRWWWSIRNVIFCSLYLYNWNLPFQPGLLARTR